MRVLLVITKNLNEQIKVCHVTNSHTRFDVRIFYKECKSLANNGFNVTLLVNDNHPDESVDGIKIVSTKLEFKNRFERMFKSKKQIRKHMLQIDANIYHFHDPELLSEATWIKKKGKKVIFDFHEDVSQQILFKTWIPKILRGVVSTLYKYYENKQTDKFDALITVTPKFVERLKQINPNTVMVTNYPIINKKNVDKKEVSKKKAICFAGGISPQWNHENIIKAIESINDVEYILAGNGPPDYIEKLKKLNGWDKVRFLGRIPHEEVIKIYNESMVGMTLLSHDTQVGDEGTLGNTKIFEFMEAGLPVICSNNKLWNEIVESNQCGKSIDSGDIQEITDAIIHIITNPEIASKMGINGKKAVYDEFNWETQERVLLKLYKILSELH